MNKLGQIIAVTLMNLRSIPLRKGPSLVIVVGISGVVAVLTSYLALVSGITQTTGFSGGADRAIVLSGGATTETASVFQRTAASMIMDIPGIKKDTDGKPILSAEAVLQVRMRRKGDDAEAAVTVRGVSEKAFVLRPEMKLAAGRMFRPGLHELLVGKGARLQFKQTELGDRVRIRNTVWTVTGIFESGGGMHESGLIADLDTLMSAYRRTTFQSVTLALESPASFDAIKASLQSNSTLKGDVKREAEYYHEQSKRMSRLLNLVAYVIGGIMAVGAAFGAINSMYVAVGTRTREIATLRAIGFGATPVVISVFVEAFILAAAGGVIGAALAWLMFDGNVGSTVGNGANMSQLVFELTVTAKSVLIGISLSCAIGFIGSLFPALRAARLPVADALRAV